VWGVEQNEPKILPRPRFPALHLLQSAPLKSRPWRYRNLIIIIIVIIIIIIINPESYINLVSLHYAYRYVFSLTIIKYCHHKQCFHSKMQPKRRRLGLRCKPTIGRKLTVLSDSLAVLEDGEGMNVRFIMQLTWTRNK